MDSISEAYKLGKKMHICHLVDTCLDIGEFLFGFMSMDKVEPIKVVEHITYKPKFLFGSYFRVVCRLIQT